MTRDQMISHLGAANAVAREAAEHGHHPFGCVLVGPDNRILMRQGNIDVVRHAETELCRRAAAAYSPEFLWSCTLVTTFEPCAMCTGTTLLGEYRAPRVRRARGDAARAHRRQCGESDYETRLAHSARFGPKND